MLKDVRVVLARSRDGRKMGVRVVVVVPVSKGLSR